MSVPIVAIGRIVPGPVENALRASGVPMELRRLPGFSEDELIQHAGDADVVVIGSREAVTARALAGMRCKAVVRCGVGVDNVDLQAASELGILVACVPDASVEEVADHALALLLACARRIVPLHSAAKAGEWSREGGAALNSIRGELRRLRGLNLGVVGFGRIGRAAWQRARAFGFNGLVYDPLVPEEVVRSEGARQVGREELLAESDFITLHTPLTPETRGMFNQDAFARMKPTAFLINTGRGACLDENALAEALRVGRIAGAALDVTIVEPVPGDSPLMALDNVLLTAHSAYASKEAFADLCSRTADNVLDVVKGDVPRGLINADALARARDRAR